MYIAGLVLNLSPHQQLEAFVCSTTVLSSLYLRRSVARAMRKANVEGGALDPEFTPKSTIAKVVTPVHIAALSIPPLIYTVALLSNKLVRPSWLEPLSLGDIPKWVGPYSLRAHVGVLLRALASVACIGMVAVNQWILGYLGKQFHYIAVRHFHCYHHCDLAQVTPRTVRFEINILRLYQMDLMVSSDTQSTRVSSS